MNNIIYLTCILIISSGLFMMISANSYFKKIIGLALMQSGVLLFFISLGKIIGGIAPVDICSGKEICSAIYSNPLLHVLMLTAIVVGIATLSVGLALIAKIKDNFNTINEDEIDV